MADPTLDMPPREDCEAICYRFFEGDPVEMIARDFGVTVEIVEAVVEVYG